MLRLIQLILWAFVLAALFSFVRRLFTRRPPSRPVDRHPSPNLEPRLLHRDPICGKNIAAEISRTLQHGGETLHFCSTDCRERFLAGRTPS